MDIDNVINIRLNLCCLKIEGSISGEFGQAVVSSKTSNNLHVLQTVHDIVRYQVSDLIT